LFVRQYFDPREVRIMMLNGPLQNDALAAQMAISIKADYIISGGTHRKHDWGDDQ
jgi:predicted phosphodiesterase